MRFSDFNKKELLFSLFFPVIIILWGIARLTTDYFLAGKALAFSGTRVVVLFPYIAGIMGGILSALFTFVLRINTSNYFRKRLIVVGIVCVIHQIIIGSGFAPLWIMMVVGIIGILYQIFKVQDDDTTTGERVILLLSDPLIYWSIFWFVIEFIVF